MTQLEIQETEFWGDNASMTCTAVYDVAIGHDFDDGPCITTCNLVGAWTRKGYMQPRAEILRAWGASQIKHNEDLAIERFQGMLDAGELREVI